MTSGAAGVHRLHLGHDRASQGRARHATASISAATRSVAAQYPTLVEKAHRTVAYLPLCHVLGRDIAVTLAADDAARAAHRRDGGGPAGDPVRDGADRAVHRAALPAEAGRAGARAGRQHLGPQALRLRSGDRLCARATSSGAGRARRAGCSSARACRVARGGVPPGAQQDRLRQAGAGGLGRRAAAGRDHGGVAHAGRQRVRDVRPDRDGRRHHRGAARAVPAAGRRRHGAGGLRGEAGGRRRDPGALAGPVRGLLEQPGGVRWRCSATTGWMRTGDVGEWRDGDAAPDRPRARLPRHLRRQDHLAVLHRERAAGEPLPRRGGRVRPRPQVSRPR